MRKNNQTPSYSYILHSQEQSHPVLKSCALGQSALVVDALQKNVTPNTSCQALLCDRSSNRETAIKAVEVKVHWFSN